MPVGKSDSLGRGGGSGPESGAAVRGVRAVRETEAAREVERPEKSKRPERPERSERPERPAAASPRAVFVTVIAAVFVANLDLLVVNVALSDIGADFHGTSLDSLSWILNAYAIVFAALLVVAGRLADRGGHREGFLAGLVVFTGGSLLCAVAPDIGFLIAARAVQAVGAALLLPTSLALLLAVTPPARRTTVVRAWSSVGGAAAALGPVLGGLLVNASWRWVFIINVPIGVAALVLGLRVLPRTPGTGRGTPMPDLAGAGLLTVAVAALSLALVEGDDWGWTTPGPLAGFAAAAVLGALVVARSARHPSPVIELPMLRIAQFSLATVAALLVMVCFVAMILSIMLYCQDVWHYSALRTGLAFAPGPLMLPPIVAASTPLIRRVGSGPVAALGCLFLGGGVLSWVGSDGHHAALRVRDAPRRDPHRRRRRALAAHAGRGDGHDAAAAALRDRVGHQHHGPADRRGARRRDPGGHRGAAADRCGGQDRVRPRLGDGRRGERGRGGRVGDAAEGARGAAGGAAGRTARRTARGGAVRRPGAGLRGRRRRPPGDSGGDLAGDPTGFLRRDVRGRSVATQEPVSRSPSR